MADTTCSGPVEADARYEAVRRILAELESVAVAFSAGADSTFILKAAVDALGPSRVVAVTGRSHSLADREYADARRLASSIGVEHVTLDTTEFENEHYLSNPTNRCYFCKTTLYAAMRHLADERGIRNLVNGTNVDDLGDHRPGLKAASEFGVKSPAAEAGLTKADIRALSAALDLPTSDKPASPCLSSRVPYGERITPDKLRAIEAAEDLLIAAGLRECRVRCHGDLARIEVPRTALACVIELPDVIEGIKALGFAYVTLDLEGFRSGSLNEVIAFGKRQG